MPNRAAVTLPTPISEISLQLREVFPGLIVQVDRPADPEGEWWLDLRLKRFRCTVAWRPRQGFGVFTSKSGYNDRPDEVYRSTDVAVRRVRQLVHHWQASSTTPPLSLSEIRELLATPQTAVAEALDVHQAAISRLERRRDMKLSSLQSYLQAMGGRLEIRVHFDTFDAGVSVPPDDDTGS
jgi:hypothetical protein